MKLTKLDRQIVQDVFKATEGLYMFTLYSRYNVSPSELFDALKGLKDLNILEISADRISITREGFEFATKNQIHKKESYSKKSKLDQSLYVGPQIPINSFYIPKNFDK